MKNLTLIATLVCFFTSFANGNAFRVGSGSLTARVEHPFQVVELVSTDFKARLEIDLSDPNHGVTLEAHVPTAGLMPPGRLGNYLQPRLPAEISFQSTRVETLIYEPQQNPLLGFQMVVRGTLVAGETKSDTRVTLKCTNDAPALRCTVHQTFPITNLGLPVPRMLWVKAKNDVAIDGEVFFAPEGTK